jgi:D-glycero-D-manno-heptose 1,7-bisphosphate phosphatase
MLTELNRALFLDRDGIINVDHGYVYKVIDFIFFEEIFEISSLAQKTNLKIVIVTNQSGIGRGLFSEEDFSGLTDWMISAFDARGIKIDLVLHSPLNPDSAKRIEAEQFRRKPQPGMFFEAKEFLNLDLVNSIMIGDKETDMIAAERAGVGHRILLNPTIDSQFATIRVESHAECRDRLSQILVSSRE